METTKPSYNHTTTETFETFEQRNRCLYSIGCYQNGDTVILTSGDAKKSKHELKKGVWIRIPL